MSTFSIGNELDEEDDEPEESKGQEYQDSIKSTYQVGLIVERFQLIALDSLLHTKVSKEQVVSIFQQLLKIFVVAESAKAFQGNLKPSRIFVQEGKNIKLSFFGLAKLCNMRKFRQDELAYLSPKLQEVQESNIRDKFNSKDDVYAVGKVLGKFILGDEQEITQETLAEKKDEFGEGLISLVQLMIQDKEEYRPNFETLSQLAESKLAEEGKLDG